MFIVFNVKYNTSIVFNVKYNSSVRNLHNSNVETYTSTITIHI